MLFIVILSLFMLQCVKSQTTVVDGEVFTYTDIMDCIDLGNITKFGHVGWPIFFRSDDIISPAKTANMIIYSIYRKKNATVTLLKPNGSLSWSLTDTVTNLRYNPYPYEKFEVTENMSLPFVMAYQISEANYCSKLEIYVQRDRVHDNSSCFYPVFSPASLSLTYKNSKTISCEVSYGTYPKIFADPEDLEYEWWYNCSKNFPPNIKGLTTKQITISNADFYDGGRYTCAVKFMGQKRFLAPSDVCVKHGNSGTYAIKCQENVEGDEGQELNITCVVDFGKGQAFYHLYRMQWLKLLGDGSFQEICASQPYDGLLNSTDGDPRIQCENKKIEVPSKCYGYVPSLEQQIAPNRRFRLTMLIKDFRKSDAGRYLLSFTVLSNDFQNHTFAITLNKDPALTQQAVYIVIGVVVVLVLGSLLALCLWKRRDIRWFTKKHFGAYEKDDKEYVAYMAYHYSIEDLTKSTQNLTKNIVKSVIGFIENMNGTTYDDNRDGDPTQQHIENIAMYQQKCHRIIVILNEEYITDQWNMHKVYHGIQTMIEGGAKVIFILLPGIVKNFNDLADEPRSALKLVMKTSTTIQWSGNLPLNGSFRRQLEYALPKLKKRERRQNNNNRMQTVV